MLEIEIGLADGGKLNFYKPLQQFNGNKKIYAKNYFKRTFSI